MQIPDEVMVEFNSTMADAEVSITFNELASSQSMAIGTFTGWVMHPLFELTVQMIYKVEPDEPGAGVADTITIVGTLHQNEMDPVDVVYADQFSAIAGPTLMRLRMYMEAFIMSTIVEDVLGIDLDKYSGDDDAAAAAWN